MQRRSRLAVRKAVLAVAASALVGVVVLVAGAGSGGCQSPTQVTVELRTFGALPCTSLKGVAIAVGATPEKAEDQMRLQSFSAEVARGQCDPDGHTIGTLVVTPSADTGAIMVRARFSDAPDALCEAPAYKGCIIARRSFSFIEHTPVTLPISLEAACVDVPCNVASSCRNGVCVDSRVDCESSGTCHGVAEPMTAPDGGVIPPPPDAEVDTGMSFVDSSPEIDAAIDAPGVDAADAATDADADAADGAMSFPDGSTDGGISKGLCPTNGGPINCNAAGLPVCCADMAAQAFICTLGGQCPGSDPHFNCTGPIQCGGGVCCGGFQMGVDAAMAYTASCYGPGTVCSMLNNMDTICASDLDCTTLDKPHCSKPAVTLTGHTVWACGP